MAVDLEEFRALSGKTNTCRCPVAPLLDGSEDGELLAAAIAEDQDEITNAGISRWLKRRDKDVTWQAIRNHRNGSCACRHEQP